MGLATINRSARKGATNVQTSNIPTKGITDLTSRNFAASSTRAGELAIDLFRDLFDGIWRDYPLLRQKAGKQHAIAEQVDAPRDSRARGEDRFERVRHDERHALPADTFEPMLYVGPRVIGVQRTDMARRDHALAQCMQLGGLQDRAEFWLSDQEALQQGTGAKLEIRQHAQLFDGLRRQVLCLVDDQQASLALAGMRGEQGLERKEQLRLGKLLRPDSKGGCDHAQRIFRIQLRADEAGGDHLPGIQLGEEIANQRRLSGPDLSGDDDESLALMQPVFDKRHRAPVLPAVKVELRIRVELERLSGESVERFVHGRATSGSTRCRRSRFPDSSRAVSSCRIPRAVRQPTPTSWGRAGSRGARCKNAAESAGWSWSSRRSAMKLRPVSPC